MSDLSDEYQIELPPSFYALFTDARQRLTAPLKVVRARYEVCEDLANHLTEHALAIHREIGVPGHDVLERIERGLLSPDAGVSASEATWVTRRLAELLGWAWAKGPFVDDSNT